MYTTPFDYHRASNLDDALKMLADNPDAKLLAGRPLADSHHEAAAGGSLGPD